MASRSNQETKARNFKKGFDANDCKQKRQDSKFSFSKNKRDDMLMKKRREIEDDEPESVARPTTLHDGMIREYCIQLQSNDMEVKQEAAHHLRKVLSIEHNPPIDEVIASGAVPLLVQELTRIEFPKLQLEAAWALTNIASGTSEHTGIVVQSGAVPHFCVLLGSADADVREQAVWALGNIAGDSPALRDIVLNAGGMTGLLVILSHESSTPSMLRNATWTLSNFCRGKPQPSFAAIEPSIPCLAHLVQSSDTEVLTDALWGLSYVTDGANEKIQAVVNSGVLPRLISLLGHSMTTVQTPALRCAGNVVTGDDGQTQAALDAGLLPYLLPLLASSKKGIKKEACWAISNITAGTAEQIQAVLEANLLAPILGLLYDGPLEVRKEAAWAVSNATSGGNKTQLHYIVQQNGLAALCEMLTVKDDRAVVVALEGIENILKNGETAPGVDNEYCSKVEECDGLEKIESLQHHANEKIYEAAVRILENYFEGEDEEDHDDLAPTAGPNGYSFEAPAAGVPVGGFQF